MFKKLLSGVAKTWSWLNGKKTIIGMSMIIVSDIIDEPVLHTVLRVGGLLLGGTGVAHKVSKENNAKNLPFQKNSKIQLPEGLRKNQ